MVNPSCAIATDGTVDDVTISDIEKEGVVRLRKIPGRTGHRGFPWDTFSLVLADQFPAQDRHGREHTFAVNGRAAYRDSPSTGHLMTSNR